MENLKHFLSQLNGKGAKIFQDFCESTSLHGYSYLYIAQSKFLKVFWVMVLITMTSLGIVFLVDNTMDYIEADVVTTIKSFTANLSVSTIILKIYAVVYLLREQDVISEQGGKFSQNN